MKVWESVACPTCGQPAGSKCRSIVTRRTTDTHTSRYDAEAVAAKARWKEEATK